MAQKTDHLKPTQFKPGQSGNPKGRPPGRTIGDRWRARMMEPLTAHERSVFRALLRIPASAKDPPGLKDKVYADLFQRLHETYLLQKKDLRGFKDVTEIVDGKPVQPISDPDGNPIPGGSSNVLVITVTGNEEDEDN